jgi:solute:Na+ symporter, SSS family
LTCKDERVGRKGVYLSMIPLLFMTIMAPLVGLGLRLLFPQQASGLVALALLIKDRLPLWVSIIIVLGIWASSLVWGAACQFSGASSVGRDIGKALGLSHTPQHEKFHTQIALVIVTIILVVFATLRPGQAAWWSVFAFTIRNSSQISLMLGALIWTAMSVRAAYASMVVGGVLSFVWYALASFSTTNFFLGIHPMWIGMSLALFGATLWMAGESIYCKHVRMVWAGVDTKNTYQYVISALVIFLGGFILYDRHWLLLNGVLGPLLFTWSIIFFYVGTVVIVSDDMPIDRAPRTAGKCPV